MQDDFVEFQGNTIITGTLTGPEGSSKTTRFWDNLTIDGSINPGAFGDLTVLLNGSASVNYGGHWRGSIELCGSGFRTYTILLLPEDLPYNNVYTQADAVIELAGINMLNGITITEGSQFTVGIGASLGFVQYDTYYTGELNLLGSILNVRRTNVQDMLFHNLQVHTDIAYPEAYTLAVTHSMAPPDNLPGSTGETWTISAVIPQEGMTGDLTFIYNLVRVANPELFISLDNGTTWSIYPGEYTINPALNTLMASDAPLNAKYAISSAVSQWESTAPQVPVGSPHILRPLFTWNPVYDGTAYYVLLSADSEFNNIVSVSDITAETSCQFSFSLAADTEYWWKVFATSSVFGDLESSSRSFTTRAAITSNLPTEMVYLPGEAISFYLPDYIQNLMPEESITVTPFGTPNLNVSYEDGILSVTPFPGWTGEEQITLEISDGSTTLTRQIRIAILGSPRNLQISVDQSGENPTVILTFDEVPGAEYYMIHSANSPEGPWAPCGYTQITRMAISHSETKLFYRVTANTGALPRAIQSQN